MEHVRLGGGVDEVAPDGSEARLLAKGRYGSMAHFTLARGTVSAPKQHRSVEELWFFVAGSGQMCVGDDVVDVGAGSSLVIPSATRFQFRADDGADLVAVVTTMPPWPGDDEAVDADPFW